VGIFRSSFLKNLKSGKVLNLGFSSNRHTFFSENCKFKLVFFKVVLLNQQFSQSRPMLGGSVAEWLACWTQAQKGPSSNRSRDAVG